MQTYDELVEEVMLRVRNVYNKTFLTSETLNKYLESLYKAGVIVDTELKRKLPQPSFDDDIFDFDQELYVYPVNREEFLKNFF
jgi:hypothetical protein